VTTKPSQPPTVRAIKGGSDTSENRTRQDLKGSNMEPCIAVITLAVADLDDTVGGLRDPR